MASIDVRTTGSASGSNYVVTWTVTSATGMPEEIFKVKFSDNTLYGVVSPSDLSFPTARTAGQAYYRQHTISATYDTLSKAAKVRQVVSANIQLLVDAYNNDLTDFLVTTDTSYT